MELHESKQSPECKFLHNISHIWNPNMQEKSRFCQPIDNYPNRIKNLWSARNTSE